MGTIEKVRGTKIKLERNDKKVTIEIPFTTPMQSIYETVEYFITNPKSKYCDYKDLDMLRKVFKFSGVHEARFIRLAQSSTCITITFESDAPKNFVNDFKACFQK